ncbi:hypothetical protein AX16_007545 [Volvariella volvacea WC 439]|nr:hypothetical protein AX16_007545 [Volvariella volvacea WC 439]
MGDSEGRVVIEGDHHGSDDARGASDAAQQRGIPPSLYDDLVHYLKYASSAYVPLCPRPNGKTLVTQFSNPITDIIGFVARNDGHRELIVSIRGSLSVTNFLEDSQIVLVPWLAPGISATHGARVHSGFLLAWNSIVVQILAIISEQLLLYPGYAIIATGHSLGGAVATLAAASLQGKFPENQVRLYSYGAPRVGNQVFAQRFNEEFGTRAYRGKVIPSYP